MIDKDTIKLLMKKDSALNIIVQSIQLRYIISHLGKILQ